MDSLSKLRRNYRIAARADRIATRASMRSRGVTPTKPVYVWCVQPQTIFVPDWAKKAAIRELSCTDEVVWLRRGGMKDLLMQDGGHALVTKTEMRRCGICGRLMLGIAAEDRRMKEQSYSGRQAACDDGCTQRAWTQKGVALK